MKITLQKFRSLVKKQRIIILFLFTTFFSLCIPQSALAFGVGPAYHTFTDLINGVKVPVTIMITRGNPSTNEVAAVSVDGDGAKYIVLPETAVSLPKGKQRVAYTFYVHPKNAANGDYQTTITFAGGVVGASAGGKVNEGGSGVSFRSGASISVKFSVSDKQIRSFEINDVSSIEAEAGGSQLLPFTFLLKNTGNVDARPDYIQITITKATDPNFIVSHRIEGKTIEVVPPNEQKEISVKIPSELPVGNYLVSAAFFLDGKDVARRSDLPVRILPPGSLAQKVEFSDLAINGSAFATGDVVKFDATMKNSGQLASEATVIVEISRDGKVIDVLNGQQRFLAKGQLSENSVFYKPNSAGSYSARAYIDYKVGKSGDKTFEFEVSTSAMRMVMTIGLGLLILIGSALGIRYFMQRKHLHIRKKRK